jgi:hypothetical protein
MYHTQERRTRSLSAPIICNRKDAWLGDGYYFWRDLTDATQWGHKCKRKYGYFQIYVSSIECDNVLDTVFNEEQYDFWVKQIEKAATHIIKKTGIKPSIRELNQYLRERANWKDAITGIMFQDLPFGEDLLVEKLNYRKRIQIAVYDKNIICTFALHEEIKCNDKKI